MAFVRQQALRLTINIASAAITPGIAIAKKFIW